jgi:hypothetical protein
VIKVRPLLEQWEYCVVAPVPSGPLVITITYYQPDGAKRVQHRTKDYDEGVNVLWPKVIAELGLEGWELVTVDTGAWHFKRRLPGGEA